jgi:site-specific DNA recombinase
MMSHRARPDRRGTRRDGIDGRESASGAGLAPAAHKLRCAVYTRKSTEEGLDMEFNSLDAQREACEAYIVSQRTEGWLPVRDRYDDGGVSGGTLERPALKRLLADVEAGKIDVVLVYKIDRLSRSMLDFLKLVETFEHHGVTFVSITQAFNTTSSMGRLTLNMLLSFAQFEREVIGERIRDKVAASRKKGMWMGGWTPLGYEVRDRKLLIHKEDAEQVLSIFKRFAQLKSATLLARELVVARATNRYGQLLDKGVLYRILNNRVYIGDAVHTPPRLISGGRRQSPHPPFCAAHPHMLRGGRCGRRVR